jgi:hypothetical protein
MTGKDILETAAWWPDRLKIAGPEGLAFPGPVSPA